MKPDDPVPAVTPTRAELVLLNVLWNHGPATVRAVHEAMPLINVCGYTTILKLLQIMHGKGLVARDTSARAHVYRPVFSKTTVQTQLISDLVQQAFNGCPVRLIMQTLGSTATANAGDLDKIRKLLNQLEKRQPQV